MLISKIFCLSLWFAVLSATLSFHKVSALAIESRRQTIKTEYLTVDNDTKSVFPLLKTSVIYAENGKSFQKSWKLTLLLCVFAGFLGAHRFYLGYTWQGVAQLLTLGGFGIWLAVDLARLLFKHLKPANRSRFKP